jgi:hypothetical protein
MAVTPTPIFPQSIISRVTVFTSATSTSTPVSILPTQTNGCKVEEILISSSDTSARDLLLYLDYSGTNSLFATISIPATSGQIDTISTVSVFKAVSGSTTLFPLPLDANGNPYLYLDATTALTASPLTVITTAKVWNIAVIGGAF